MPLAERNRIRGDSTDFFNSDSTDFDLPNPSAFSTDETGLTGQQEAYCPYCRYSAAPTGFHTRAQQEYAKRVLTREATKGVQNMLRSALGFRSGTNRNLGGGLSLTYKPGRLPPVGRRLEEELRRDLTCPSCGLSHAVFGIAVWCPDCGRDIFLTHVEHEYDVTRKMLSVVEDRRRDLGARVAARDVENALEDTVSIFEAVLKSMTARRLRMDGKTESGRENISGDRPLNRIHNTTE
jgi:hypothetical protein